MIHKDQEFAKYIRDNNSIKKKKNLRNIANNIDQILQESESLHTIRLSRPISGIKKLIKNNTVREESPDSCKVDEKILNESPLRNSEKSDSIRNRKGSINNDEFIYLNHNKIRNSKTLNIAPKKEIFKKKQANIETIEEENIDLYITGIKFNLQNKPISSFTNKLKFENQKLNKKNSIDILPHLMKSSSSLFDEHKKDDIKIKTQNELINSQISQSSLLDDNKASNHLISKNSLKHQFTFLNTPVLSNEKFKGGKNNIIKISTDNKTYNLTSRKDDKKTSTENINVLKNSFPKLIINNKKPILTHTIIDYSIHKSDFILEDDKNFNSYKNIFTVCKSDDSKIKDNFSKMNKINKLKNIKDENIKALLEKSKIKGSYAPYFSLCKNCNQRNNDFYNYINSQHALGILNHLNKDDYSKKIKLEKF